MNASLETLLDQAGGTADQYLAQAIDSIDKRFGNGFAKNNPSLVGDHMRVQAQDYHTAVITVYGVKNLNREL